MLRLAVPALLALALAAPAHADVDLAVDGHLRIVGPQQGSLAGASIASAGDVNGDGLGDVVVGVPLASRIGGNEGAAYVVFGRREPGVVDLAKLGDGGIEIRGAVRDARLGTSVAGVGDVDGDGLADVAVSGPLFSPSRTAYVVHGRRAGGRLELSHPQAGVTSIALPTGVLYAGSGGHGISGAGDVDGDGLADVLLHDLGMAFVVLGGPAGRAVQLDLRFDGGFALRTPMRSLRSAAAAGDLDGDGRGDLAFVLGGERPYGRLELPPEIVVVRGGARTEPVELTQAASDVGRTVWPPGQGRVRAGARPGELLVADPAAGGNGGRVWRVLAPDWGASAAAPAATELLAGRPDGLLRTGDGLGTGVATIGGARLLVGAPFAVAPNRPGAGGALLVAADGSAERVHGAHSASRAGEAVTALGDADGDGAADLAIGAPWQSTALRPRAGVITVLGTAGRRAPPLSLAERPLLPSGRDPLVADGEHTLVVARGGGQRPVVLDTRSMREVTPPSTPACPAHAVGGGRMVVVCDVASPDGMAVRRPYVVSLRTGQVARPPIPAGYPLPYLRRFTGVGRHWLAAEAEDSRGSSYAVYVNWRTGAVDTDHRGLTDLDSRTLVPPRGRRPATAKPAFTWRGGLLTAGRDRWQIPAPVTGCCAGTHGSPGQEQTREVAALTADTWLLARR